MGCGKCREAMGCSHYLGFCAFTDLTTFSLSFCTCFQRNLLLTKYIYIYIYITKRGLKNGRWTISMFLSRVSQGCWLKWNQNKNEWKYNYQHVLFSFGLLILAFFMLRFLGQCKTLRWMKCDPDSIFNRYRCLRCLLFTHVEVRFSAAAV